MEPVYMLLAGIGLAALIFREKGPPRKTPAQEIMDGEWASYRRGTWEEDYGELYRQKRERAAEDARAMAEYKAARNTDLGVLFVSGAVVLILFAVAL